MVKKPNHYPTKFMMVVNPSHFAKKVTAVEFVKLLKGLEPIAFGGKLINFSEMLVKMIGNHQSHLSYVPKGKFTLTLQGIGRVNRNAVNKFLSKIVN